MKPYDVAIIPCTSGKHANGLTPLTLYKGGPFKLMMRHAQQRTHSILIMSAKYGLLRLDDPVSYYDAYLPDLDATGRAELIERIRNRPLVELLLPGEQREDDQPLVLSYLPKAYHQLLMEALEFSKSKYRRPYANLGMLSLFAVLSNEIKNYGKLPARR